MFSICTSVCFAEEQSNNTDPTTDELPVLPIVTVEAERIAPTTGTVILDQELIQGLPQRNGSTNEIIGIIPGVQYTEEYNSSLNGGEIIPSPVSISGSRFYDNSYTIDGLNNTSILNPAEDSYKDANKLPGYPQKQILNPRIIEEISVYHSNIPAEHGGFSGGQINVKLIEPSPEFWGQISFRTTNDNWTQFHIDPEEEGDFHEAADSDYQPQFSKQDFGVILNTPVSRDTAFITAYEKIMSRIMLNHVDGKKWLRRERENIMLKVGHQLPGTGNFSISGIYSPSHSTYAANGISQSNYAIDQDTYSLNVKLQKELSMGTIYAQVGFSSQKIERQSPADKYRWDAEHFEGGIGDLQYSHNEASTALSFELNPIDTKQISNKIKTGISISRAKLTYNRPETSNYYYVAIDDPEVECLAGDSACIEGTGYLKNRTVYSKTKSSNSETTLELFIQDSMLWKRLELFPGIRLGHDSMTSDIHIAPRFSTSLDLWGNGSTILFAGRNRYFSSTLLEQGHYHYFIQTRDSSTSEWETTSSSYFIDKDIEAPYADETNIGFIQSFLGGELKTQYIYKKYRKEFARSYDKETKTYTLNNNGRSEHDSLQVSWQRNWRRQYVEINATWQVSKTSNKLYRDTLNDEDTDETFWYEDKEYHYYEMPRTDYNRPTVINLIYRTKLPFNLQFANTTKYRGKYWYLHRTKETRPSQLNPDLEDPYVYEKLKAKSAITFDWSVQWQIPGLNYYETVVNFDILNVFNKRNKQGYNGDYYEIGRQFWLGVDVNF